MNVPEAVGIDSSALCELLGCTYRQLDHWTRQGYVPASDPCPGSGVDRTYPLEAIAVAGALAAFVRAGYTPAAAAHYAAAAVPAEVDQSNAAGHGGRREG